METVISRDGTRIAYERTGSGPPLILVHGAAGSHERWAPILPALSAEFTVCAMDRRGRGGSGDSTCYAIEREFEDVVAVVDSLGEPVNVLGHSSGGTFAVEAALLTDNINKLILYEPATEPPDMTPETGELVACLNSLLAAGDQEGVLTTFMRTIVGMSEEEIEHYRGLPTWRARVAAAHTLPREIEAESAYQFEPERFVSMNVPTLLITGGDSPPLFRAGVRLVDQALPDSRIAVIPGQQHIADVLAPDIFVRVVLDFLRGA